MTAIPGRRVDVPSSRVDRSRSLRFRFDGQWYIGHPGDTLASALLANGVRLVARSFKYGRPRGIVGFGPEESNALVQLEEGGFTVPNAKATQIELYDGLIAARTSGSPSLAFDLKSIAGLAHRFMPAGFYSKTFKWPARLWPFYERVLRSQSGFGSAPSQPDPEHYDHLHHHVDVLVVGAGIAGLVAAREAGEAGRSVLLLDEQPQPGGWALSEPGLGPVDEHSAALAALPNVRLLTRTVAFGLYDHNLCLAVESLQDHLPPSQRQAHLPRQRQHRIRATEVVLATGAIERPMVFGDNDRPGVMTVAAGLTYLNRYGVLVGERIVLFGAHDRLYSAANAFASAGAQAVTVIDLRAAGEGSAVAVAPEVTVLRGHGIERVLGAHPLMGGAIRAVAVRRVVRGDTALAHFVDGPPIIVPADTVLSAAGLVPTVHLHCHDGSRPQWRDDCQAFVMPANARPGVRCVGAVTGAFDRQEPRNPQEPRDPLEPPVQSNRVVHVRDPRPENVRGQAFVDLQNDVKVDDIELAVRENHRAIEHVKRYTALGFGTDQGKLSNVNGFLLAAHALEASVAQVGTTVYRPAYSPVSFGALAGPFTGDTFAPVRTTPIHDAHVAAGARFEPVGQWQRAWYYPRAGESIADCVARECTAARTAVAVMDASTLGKIQVDGPDAREFLGRIYANALAGLRPGHCRYGLMLDENGMVMDDGVIACLTDTRFLLTTTTVGAARVLAWLELWHQTEWPELELFTTSVTDHWATIAVVGPKSREVLCALGTDIALARESFPFMTWREGRLAGLPVRLLRVSFSGELAFEIFVEAGHALDLWEAVMQAGAAHGITPYGTEAMHVLRAEKGFIIVGQDTDGSVSPIDLGMGWAVAMNKPFPFLGKRSLARTDTARADRKQLVGLLTEDPDALLPEGAQIIEAEGAQRPMPMLGHVSSSYRSATLGRTIALALVRSGRERMGARLFASARGRSIPVKVVDPVFVDPEGVRQRG